MLPRFYPIVDTSLLCRRGIAPSAATRALLEAGVQIIQLRHKGAYDRDVHKEAETMARMCREAGALFVINDRADVAMLLDAALHVGQDDLPPADARRLIGQNRRLGFSTHNELQFQNALQEPVNYIALGPIFGTYSKENPDPVVGVEELRRLRTLSALPVVAIGGITRALAPAVWEAGADSIAVIGDLYPPECPPEMIRETAEEWIRIGNA